MQTGDHQVGFEEPVAGPRCLALVVRLLSKANMAWKLAMSLNVANDPKRTSAQPKLPVSSRADRNLDQIRCTGRNGRLQSGRDVRCSTDTLGGDAHGRGKRQKIDGWVNDFHGDEAIGTRRRIMWL